MKSQRVLCAVAACLLPFLTATTARAATLPVTDNLHVWYDASQGVDGTATVTGWADQANPSLSLLFTAYNLSVPGSVGTEPSLMASDAALGGMPSIDFDGTNDALRANYGGVVGLSDASIFVVFVPEAKADGQMLVAHRSGNPLIQANFKQAVATVQAYENVGSIDSASVSDSGWPDWDGVGKIGFFEVNGSGPSASDSVTVLIDGGLDLPPDTQPATLTGAINSSLLTVGAFSTSSSAPNNGFFTGRIAEIIIYRDILTTEEKNLVGNYLELKYGLDTAYTPEPGTLAMLAGGALGLLLVARRRHKKA